MGKFVPFHKKDKALSRTVEDAFSLDGRYKDKDFALELEHEGATQSITSSYWNSVRDGSLREGGIEYVMRGPAKITKLKQVLNQWRELTTNCQFDLDSANTSTHVHINVKSKTYVELISFLCCYYLIEDSINHLCDDTRKGNLFCLDKSL